MYTSYHKINEFDIAFFKSILAESSILIAENELLEFASDYTEDLVFLPDLVLKPQTVQQVSEILGYCNTHHISVTPRGAGTGLSGGSLPIHGGISLCMTLMDAILDLDVNNMMATVQPGIINEAFQQHIAAHGLFYPPDPASKGSCQLGGNVAHSGGGPRALKYGTTKDYILNLQIVLPEGTIMWTGANTLKNSTGYNLTQLMIGSEGTLAVVTAIVVKLIPLPKYDLSLMAGFSSAIDACACVSHIFLAGVSPSALEFMEVDALRLSILHTGSSYSPIAGAEAFLLIELNAHKHAELEDQAALVYEVLEQYNVIDVEVADTENQKGILWGLRRKIGEAVKLSSIYKEEDTVVPRHSLPILLQRVKEIGSRYYFSSICYGHAGDGNLHVNIMKGNMNDEDWDTKLIFGIREIFGVCKQLKGTISGEHGIGLVQKSYLDIVFDPIHFKLMRGIKRVFDPNNILNPSKIFDLE